MAEEKSPITQQIQSGTSRGSGSPLVSVDLREVEDCVIYDRHGTCIPFKSLFQDRKSIIIFVRNFLCYSCKEYVDDLSKIPEVILKGAGVSLVVIGQSAHHHIQPFCSLTGYAHEIYVDPKRIIYQKLGMKREAKFTDSAQPSPHVKSGVFMGQMKSLWRAITSPVFDFQGDIYQQGGAIIAGPGPQVHFLHFDANHLDHMPINWLLQLAGIEVTLNFSKQAKVIHV
ncbi:peroxiredoxin-like 2C isoform X3 [Corythoichthys intestinalis]|uniref:peroxiredoxin-like 2C isoform X3 n=1 Tax=Corythoichthys intestinalis TaxID=161448 RepID=UPI0025A66B44|nr:peroxiredoxin-like 2C isoform X3 [Corythoichthys intestinalis]XP_061804771.1 peroxiredoxin-like 2C [Nerophis lumbriciformis]